MRSHIEALQREVALLTKVVAISIAFMAVAALITLCSYASLIDSQRRIVTTLTPISCLDE
jgi:hypothetical protein